MPLIENTTIRRLSHSDLSSAEPYKDGMSVAITTTLTRLILALFTAYIVSLNFLTLFEWPIVGTKIQLPELLILALGLMMCTMIFKMKPVVIELIRSRTFLWTSFLIVSILISSIYHSELGVSLEMIGLIYLYLSLILFVFILKSLPQEGLKEYVLDSFLLAGFIGSVVACVGFIFSTFGIESRIAPQLYAYPYFGDVNRLLGFNPSPNMLFYFLCTVLILNYERISSFGIQSKKVKISILIIGLISILTYSKSLVLLAVALLSLVMYDKGYINSPFTKVLILTIIVGAVIFLNALTNYILVPNGADKVERYTPKESLVDADGYKIYESIYLKIKRGLMTLSKENIFSGIGLGRTQEALQSLKERGLYPRHFSVADPHSTYLGLLAEAGLMSFMAFMIWVGHLLNSFISTLRRSGADSLLIGSLATIVLLLVDAINTDILNFRFLWVLLAIVTSYSISNREVDIIRQPISNT